MRRALTLVELLLAMTVGAMVVMTVFLGFRVMQTSIGVGSRQTQENRLLTDAFVGMLDEVDYWTFYDAPEGDPEDSVLAGEPTGRRLRTNFDNTSATRDDRFSGDRYGQPFTPLQAVSGLGDYVNPRVRPLQKVATGTGEAERGWNPDYHWAAADPRTWFRGDFSTFSGMQRRFGRYELFSHPKAQVSLGWTGPAPTGLLATNASNYPFITGTFGTVAPSHSWRDNQLLGLRNALGLYGLLDYLPANAITTVPGMTSYESGTWQDLDDAISPLWQANYHARTRAYNDPTGPGSPPGVEAIQLDGLYANQSGRTNQSDTDKMARLIALMPRTPYAVTMIGGNATVPATVRRNDQASLADFVRAGSANGNDTGSRASFYGMGKYNGGDIAQLRSFVSHTTIVRPMLVQQPEAWPTVLLSISRTINLGHFASTCAIRWTSPVTGRMSEISFNAIGTTLRGARQQRHRDGGWAAPGDPTLDDY